MATARLNDELWKLLEPLLPARKGRLHHPGRNGIDDHRTLPASCSCCVPGSPGSSCRRNSGTAPA
jgi:transposase